MRTMKKLMLAALAAGVLLSLIASTATALRSLSINERSIHVHFRALVFAEEGGLGITCRVTIRKVFNSNVIAKSASEIGNVVEVAVRECRDSLGVGVTVTPLIEARAPWVLLFGGFTGTLPEILSVTLYFADLNS